ncbi:unnamed protein product [Nippostrongylus brasiliensis]|uniref:EGF-like domain-containing protein n=1 Tax=Nippostrongylus brasiliensis TaxID=27835 RepID=A0A0N4YDA5_NIPBR|nr:unnamed protein product [Nippostrongylus brasiliensis]
MNPARILTLSLVLNCGNLPIRGNDEQNGACSCFTGIVNGICFKTKPSFLSQIVASTALALKDCDEGCIDREIYDFLKSEKTKFHFALPSQSYVIRCPCLCKEFCEKKSSYFDKIDCPTTTTELGEQHSSFPSKISTATLHQQSTVEDHPTSDKGHYDFGSTSSQETTIHSKAMPSTLTSNAVTTFTETSLKEEPTDVTTLTASQPPQKTGTTVTTSTVDDDITQESAHFSQARLTTSTVGIYEVSTSGHLSTSETSQPSTSESITSSTLGTTIGSIRTSDTTLPVSSSHAATHSTSWSSILIGMWTTAQGSETATSSSVYEKRSKITTSIEDWSTKAPTTTMTTTEASTSLTLFEKTSHMPTKSHLEESTYTTSVYKTTTLQDLHTSSEKVTERKTVSSSPAAAPSQGTSSTTIHDSTYTISTRSDLQASSEASSKPAAAPIYTATPSQEMHTSPTPKLEEFTYRTTTYPEQQESSEKASTVTSVSSLLTAILGQGKGTSTTQLRGTTTIYQEPQTSSEKVSSGPAVPQTDTATLVRGTSTTTLPDESTSFSTSDTASLKTGEGSENSAEKLPTISSRITRYYQPSSSSTTSTSDQISPSTVAPKTTINKVSSITSTSYAEVYSHLTLLSTLLHRGDGTTLTSMDEDAQGSSSTPISEKVTFSYPHTEHPYHWTTETPGISSVTSTTPTTPRFASSSETVKIEGTTLETTTLTDREILETTPPTMKESETTASNFLYFTNLAKTQQGSGRVSTTRAPKGEATIKAATTEAGQLTDSYEAETKSTHKSGQATSSTSYSFRAPAASTTDVQRFFVNERDSKRYMEEKKVRVVSLERSSRFLLHVNETVGPRSYVNNVTAACKRPIHQESQGLTTLTHINDKKENSNRVAGASVPVAPTATHDAIIDGSSAPSRRAPV